MTASTASNTGSSATAAGLLKPVALMLAGFGVLTMLGAVPVLDWPARLLFDAAFWPIDGRETLAARESRLGAAIVGGLTVGLAAMIWTVVERVLPRDPAAARAVIMNAMLSWFAVDSTGSLLAGAWFNVVLNVVFLLAVIVPAMKLPRTA